MNESKPIFRTNSSELLNIRLYLAAGSINYAFKHQLILTHMRSDIALKVAQQWIRVALCPFALLKFSTESETSILKHINYLSI